MDFTMYAQHMHAVDEIEYALYMYTHLMYILAVIKYVGTMLTIGCTECAARVAGKRCDVHNVCVVYLEWADRNEDRIYSLERVSNMPYRTMTVHSTEERSRECVQLSIYLCIVCFDYFIQL